VAVSVCDDLHARWHTPGRPKSTLAGMIPSFFALGFVFELFVFILMFTFDVCLFLNRTPNFITQLYREAIFWNLVSMQRAIEEERVSTYL
jgi:hypothetical protein